MSTGVFKERAGGIRELKPEILKQLYLRSNGHPCQLLIRMLWETGIQVREAVALKVKDLRLEEGQIRIVSTGKSMLRRGRLGPSDRCREKRERWIQLPGVLYYPLCRCVHGRDQDEFVFFARTPHSPLSARTLECYLKELGAELGLDGLCASAFRDTFILHNLRNGVTLEALQLHLGFRTRQPLKRYQRYVGAYQGVSYPQVPVLRAGGM
mgnify:CR=1 FL=1